VAKRKWVLALIIAGQSIAVWFQINDWPFSSFPMFATPPERVVGYQMAVREAHGEWVVYHRGFARVTVYVYDAWVSTRDPKRLESYMREIWRLSRDHLPANREWTTLGLLEVQSDAISKTKLIKEVAIEFPL
jgi:hypothetical protein